MIKILKNYFKSNCISEYRIVQNEIQNCKLIRIKNENISEEINNFNTYYIIFNEFGKSFYLNSNVINGNILNYINFLRSNGISRSTHFHIGYNTSKIELNHKEFNFDLHEAKSYISIINEFDYIEFNNFFHKIHIYTEKQDYYDSNHFKYIELISKDVRITSNLTEKYKFVEDLLNNQLIIPTSKLKTCESKIKKFKLKSQPISFILHYFLSIFNGANILANKSLIKSNYINKLFFNKNLSLICIQNKYLTFDSEGNLNNNFYLIKDGVIKNILCDLDLANTLKLNNTATQYNYFSNTTVISSSALSLTFDLPYNANDYDFEVVQINPYSSKLDLNTGIIACEFIGYYKNSRDLYKYIYAGSILDLVNKALYISSKVKTVEEYSFSEYIIKL